MEPKANSARAYEDSDQRLLIARKLIEAKIQRTKTVIEWLSQRYEAAKGIDEQIQKEERLLTDQHILNGLMMVEGRVAEVYWNLIAKILPPAYGFKSRIRGSREMNASDPANALLNYGYSFLETVCRKHLNAVGLDPTIGFLHEINASKHPLVYDLQEPFRWLVDTTVIQSLENREFKRSDFFRTDNYALRLKPKAVKKLLNRLREAFNSTVKYRGKAYRWDTTIFLKAQELAKHILQKTSLDFAEPSPNLERLDTLELRKRILSLSQSDAKNLGMGKSTLHYLRRNASDDKSFKIYQKVREKMSRTAHSGDLILAH
jgi:CRISPR-associated protein Cas1